MREAPLTPQLQRKASARDPEAPEGGSPKPGGRMKLRVHSIRGESRSPINHRLRHS